jgi:hypothetical protein
VAIAILLNELKSFIRFRQELAGVIETLAAAGVFDTDVRVESGRPYFQNRSLLTFSGVSPPARMTGLVSTTPLLTRQS